MRRAFAGGAWRPFAAVRLALDDRAVLYGDTVFETLRVEDGVPLFWRAHRQRLVRSLRLAAFVDRARLLREVDGLVATLPGARHAALRITLSRGEGSGFLRRTTPQVYGSLTPIDAQAAPRSIRVALLDAPRSQRSGLYAAKHGNYAFAAAAMQRVGEGEEDVVFCAGKARVYETSVGNVFIAKGRTLATPPADGTILEGTTRNLIFRAAKRLGYRVFERAISVPRLLACDEAFITSSISGLTHISHAGRRRLDGDGTLTRALFDGYRELVAAEKQ
jgi:branched-subunit amino acid aminotransferase/4-amino-4-deoxychorismate lyase